MMRLWTEFRAVLGVGNFKNYQFELKDTIIMRQLFCNRLSYAYIIIIRDTLVGILDMKYEGKPQEISNYDVPSNGK